MARPKAEINEEQVLKLAQIMCTHEEIAAFFDVDKSTISRRFATTIAKGHEIAKMSIRRKQFKLADTNAALCIWLGKQYLGQREPETSVSVFPEELLNKKIQIMNTNGDKIPERLQRFLS